MGVQTAITKLPVSDAHWEEQIRVARNQGFQDGFSEGVRETKAEHAAHLLESQKGRLAYHRALSWMGIITLAVGFLWLNVNEGSSVRGTVSGGVFWFCAGAVVLFTIFHGHKWDYYANAVKRTRQAKRF